MDLGAALTVIDPPKDAPRPKVAERSNALRFLKDFPGSIRGLESGLRRRPLESQWGVVIDRLVAFLSDALIAKPERRPAVMKEAQKKEFVGLFAVLAEMLAAAEADTAALPGNAKGAAALRDGYGTVFDLCMKLLSPERALFSALGGRVLEFLERRLLCNATAVASAKSRELAAPMLGLFHLALTPGDAPREPSPAQLLSAVLVHTQAAVGDWDDQMTHEYKDALAVVRLKRPVLSLGPLLTAATKWLDGTRRRVGALEALLTGRAAPDVLRTAVYTFDRATLRGDVADLPSGSPETATFFALLPVLTTVLRQRGQTAHAVLAREGAPILSYISLGRLWTELPRDQRSTLVAFLAACVAVASTAHAVFRGEDVSAAVASARPELPVLQRPRSSAGPRTDAPEDSPSHRVMPRIAHEVGTANAVPLSLRPLNAVTGSSLPAALLGTWSPSPRLQEEFYADAVIPCLLRLSPFLLGPTSLQKAVNRAPGGSTVTAHAAFVDLHCAPGDSMRLSADALYYSHCAQVHAELGGRAAAAHVRWLTSDCGTAPGASTFLSWEQLLASVSLRADGPGSGGTERDAQRPAPCLHIELFSATVSVHPDVLPRGLSTASVIRGLTRELLGCKNRDDDQISACCRALLVLLDIATTCCYDAGTDPSPPPWLDLQRINAWQQSSEPSVSSSSRRHIDCALTVDVDSATVDRLGPLAVYAVEQAVALRDIPQRAAEALSPLAALPWLWPDGYQSALMRHAQSPPEIERAPDASLSLGHLVDSATMSVALRASLTCALRSEIDAWGDCIAVVLRTVIPVYHSRRRSEPLQAALKLLARLLASCRSDSCLSANPIQRTPAAPLSGTATAIAAHSVLLVSSGCFPVLAMPWSVEFLSTLSALPVFADVRPLEGARDRADVVGILPTVPPPLGEIELAAVLCDSSRPWLLSRTGEPPRVAIDSGPLAMAEGYDETIALAQGVLDAALAHSPGNTISVAVLLRGSRVYRLLLWLLLRIRAEASGNLTRARVDLWEGSHGDMSCAMRGLIRFFTTAPRVPRTGSQCRLQLLEGAALVDTASPRACRAAALHAAEQQLWRRPGVSAPCLLAMPLLTHHRFASAAASTCRRNVNVEAVITSQGTALFGVQALVLAAMFEAASAATGLRIIGVIESDDDVATGMLRSAPIDVQSPSEPGASSECAAVLPTRREMLAAACVAAGSECRSALQFQRVLHVLSQLYTCAPLFISTDCAMSPLLPRFQALTTALTAFVGVHLYSVLQHCMGLSVTLAAFTPLEDPDLALSQTARFDIPAADAKATSAAASPGRAFAILHCIRSCIVSLVAPAMTSDGACQPLPSQIVSPLLAVCLAHIQAVALAESQQVAGLSDVLSAQAEGAALTLGLRVALAGAVRGESSSSASEPSSAGDKRRRDADRQIHVRKIGYMSDDDDHDGPAAAAHRPMLMSSRDSASKRSRSELPDSQATSANSVIAHSAAYSRAAAPALRHYLPSSATEIRGHIPGPPPQKPAAASEASDCFDDEFDRSSRSRSASIARGSENVRVGASARAKGAAIKSTAIDEDDEDDTNYGLGGDEAPGDDVGAAAAAQSGLRAAPGDSLEDPVTDHCLALLSDIVAVLDVFADAACSEGWLRPGGDSQAALEFSGVFGKVCSARLDWIAKVYVAARILPIRRPKHRSSGGVHPANLSSALVNIAHFSDCVQSVGACSAALASVAIAFAEHSVYAAARLAIAKALPRSSKCHIPGAGRSVDDPATSDLLSDALYADLADASDAVNNTVWTAGIRALAAILTRLATQEALKADRQAWQVTLASAHAVAASAVAGVPAMRSALEHLLRHHVSAALRSAQLPSVGCAEPSSSLLVFLASSSCRCGMAGAAEPGPALSAAVALTAQKLVYPAQFWELAIPERHSQLPESCLRKLPHVLLQRDRGAPSTPFCASFNVAGDILVTAASLIFGLLFHTDAVTGKTAPPPEDFAGMRVAQMQLAYELLVSCPPTEFDRALREVDDSYRKAGASSEGSPFPRNLSPSLDWFSRLIVERGMNSSYPRVRAAAARILPLMSREMSLGMLFSREEFAEQDPLDSFSPKVWRMLPLPHRDSLFLAELFESFARGTPSELVLSYDSMQQTDGLTLGKHLSALWAVAGIVASSPQDAGGAIIELLVRCRLDYPLHAVARRALHWAAAQALAGGSSLTGLLRSGAETIVQLWMARGLPLEALPHDLFGFRSLRALVAAYRPLFVSQGVLSSALRRVKYCLLYSEYKDPTPQVRSQADAERRKLRAYHGESVSIFGTCSGSLRGHDAVEATDYAFNQLRAVCGSWRPAVDATAPRGSAEELANVARCLIKLPSEPIVFKFADIVVQGSGMDGAADISVLRDDDAPPLMSYMSCCCRSALAASADSSVQIDAKTIADLLQEHMGPVLGAILPLYLAPTEQEDGEGDACYPLHGLLFSAAFGNMLDVWRQMSKESGALGDAAQQLDFSRFLEVVALAVRQSLVPAALSVARWPLVNSAGHHAVLGSADSAKHLDTAQPRLAALMGALSAIANFGFSRAVTSGNAGSVVTAALKESSKAVIWASHTYALLLQVRQASANAAERAAAALASSGGAARGNRAIGHAPLTADVRLHVCDSEGWLPPALCGVARCADSWILQTELAAVQCADLLVMFCAAVSGDIESVGSVLLRSCLIMASGVVRDCAVVCGACAGLGRAGRGSCVVKADKVRSGITAAEKVLVGLADLCRAVGSRAASSASSAGVVVRNDSAASSASFQSSSPPSSPSQEPLDLTLRRGLELLLAVCESLPMICHQLLHCAAHLLVSPKAIAYRGLRGGVNPANLDEQPCELINMCTRFGALLIGCVSNMTLHLRALCTPPALSTSFCGVVASACDRADVAAAALLDACTMAVAVSHLSISLPSNLLGLPSSMLEAAQSSAATQAQRVADADRAGALRSFAWLLRGFTRAGRPVSLKDALDAAVLNAAVCLHGLSLDDAEVMQARSSALVLAANVTPAYTALSILHQVLLAVIMDDTSLLPTNAALVLSERRKAMGSCVTVALCIALLVRAGSELCPDPSSAMSGHEEMQNGTIESTISAQGLGELSWRCGSMLRMLAQRDSTAQFLSYVEPGAKSAAQDSPAELVETILSSAGHVHGHAAAGLCETPLLWRTTEPAKTASRRGSGATQLPAAVSQTFKHDFQWSDGADFVQRKEALDRLRNYDGDIKASGSILPVQVLESVTLPSCLLGFSATMLLLLSMDAAASKNSKDLLQHKGVPFLNFAPDVPLFATDLFVRVRLAGALSALLTSAECSSGAWIDAQGATSASGGLASEWQWSAAARKFQQVDHLRPELDFPYHALWLGDMSSPNCSTGFSDGSGSAICQTFVAAGLMLGSTQGAAILPCLPGKMREPFQELVQCYKFWDAGAGSSNQGELRSPRSTFPGTVCTLGLPQRPKLYWTQANSKLIGGELRYDDSRFLTGSDQAIAAGALGYDPVCSVTARCSMSSTGGSALPALVLDDAFATVLWSSELYTEPKESGFAEVIVPTFVLSFSANYALRVSASLAARFPAFARNVFPLAAAQVLIEHCSKMPLTSVTSGVLPVGVEASGLQVDSGAGSIVPDDSYELQSNLLPVYGFGGCGADVACQKLSGSRQAAVTAFANDLTAGRVAPVELPSDAADRRTSSRNRSIARDDAVRAGDGVGVGGNISDVLALWVSRLRVVLAARFSSLLRELAAQSSRLNTCNSRKGQLLIDTCDFLRHVRRSLDGGRAWDRVKDAAAAAEKACRSRPANDISASWVFISSLEPAAARNALRLTLQHASNLRPFMEQLAASCAVDVDFMTLAAVARQLDRPASGLLHAELWCHDTFGTPPSISPAHSDTAIAVAVQIQRLAGLRHVWRGQDARAAAIPAAELAPLRSQHAMLESTGLESMVRGAWPDAPSVLVRIYEALDDPDALRGITGVSGLSPLRLDMTAAVSAAREWTSPGDQLRCISIDKKTARQRRGVALDMLRRVSQGRNDWPSVLCYADALIHPDIDRDPTEAQSSLACSLDRMHLQNLITVEPSERVLSGASVRPPCTANFARSELLAVILSAELGGLASNLSFGLREATVKLSLPGNALAVSALRHAVALLRSAGLAPLVSPLAGFAAAVSALIPEAAEPLDGLNSLQAAVLDGLFGPAAVPGGVGGSFGDLGWHMLAVASLSQARALRASGALSVAAVQLLKLSDVLMQKEREPEEEGASIARPPISAVKEHGARRDLEDACLAAAVETERAHLAWVSQDTQAALDLLFSSAHGLVGALLGLLGELQATQPSEDMKEWASAVGLPCAVQQLSNVFTLCGSWLAESGLGNRVWDSDGSGSEQSRGAVDLFAAYLADCRAAASSMHEPGSVWGAIRGVVELAAFRLLRWPPTGLASGQAPVAPGSAASTARHLGVASSSALLHRTMTMGVSDAGRVGGRTAVAHRRLQRGHESRSTPLYFSAAAALASSCAPLLAGVANNTANATSSGPSAVLTAASGPAGLSNRRTQACAQLALAAYADASYQAAQAQLKSSEQQELDTQAAVRKRQLAEAIKAYAEMERKSRPSTSHQPHELTKMRHFRDELQKNCAEDESTAQAFLCLLEAHRATAICTYSAYLRTSISTGDCFDGAQGLRAVFRLVSLLFDNSRDCQVVALLGRELMTVPAARLLPALPQISSRVGHDPCDSMPSAPSAGPDRDRAALGVVEFWASNSRLSAFGGVVEMLLLRLLVAAPHRVVFPLLAIAKGDINAGNAAGAAAIPNFTPPKIAAAWRVMATAAALAPSLFNAVSAAHLLSDAYSSVAAVVPDKKQDRTLAMSMSVTSLQRTASGLLQVPATAAPQASWLGVPGPQHLVGQGLPLSWLASAPSAVLHNLPVITAYHTDNAPVLSLPMDAPAGALLPEDAVFAAYSLPVYLRRGLGHSWRYADSGITCPKVLSVEGSDGRVYKQLIKMAHGSLDDTRQDAIMQQLFGLVNRFLAAAAHTRLRRLRVRTYKVIPLSHVAGVLEWVDGTVSFGSYLTGPNGAQQRYQPPGCILHTQARFELDTAHKKYKDTLSPANSAGARPPPAPLADADPRVIAARSVFDRTRPTFHHFFTDHYPDPRVWLARRTAYTRSVAAGAMVAYVAGIGDRHTSNQLVDVDSGEVVMIDFGMAFEQAKLLPTPETVFFRLTRDVVAGFGPTGIAGTFQACCEETLRVLRTQEPSLMTLLSLLLHDPLYRWAVGPERARQIQRRREATAPPVGADDAAAETTQSTAATPAAATGARRGSGVAGPADDRGAASAAAGAEARAEGGLVPRAGPPPPPTATASSRGAPAAANPVIEVGAGGSTDVDANAQRAVHRVRVKLRGVGLSADGAPAPVEVQVQRIIEEHQSLTNLARMFPGWQCYL